MNERTKKFDPKTHFFVHLKRLHIMSIVKTDRRFSVLEFEHMYRMDINFFSLQPTNCIRFIKGPTEPEDSLEGEEASIATLIGRQLHSFE
jgi:hypothetical protein